MVSFWDKCECGRRQNEKELDSIDCLGDTVVYAGIFHSLQ